MELNEVVHRIFGQHWRLIAVLVAIGIAVPLLLQARETPSYTASARVVLDTQDPESSAQATAIVDTAKAIATSPSQVQDALQRGGVTGRNPIDVAKHHVSVQGLGTSGVFELSVSDRNPRFAAAIANALAAQVIRGRLASTQAGETELLRSLDQKISDLDVRIAGLNARIASLGERISSASTTQAVALRSRQEQAQALQTTLVQQKAAIETERNTVVTSDAARPKPTIFSRATPPAAADPSHLPAGLVLGALAGFLLGLALAGLIEAFRPTLVGGDALARELDAPVLGTLPSDPGKEPSLTEAEAIAPRVELAAEANALKRVALLSGGPPLDLAALAERMQAAFPPDTSPPSRDVKHPIRVGVSDRGSVAGLPLSPSDPSSNGHVQIEPFSLEMAAAKNGSRAGVVLILPSAIKKTELVTAGNLLALGHMPLLGLITYARSPWHSQWQSRLGRERDR
jgi:capsular polysaccharide biosynthesis protein